MKIKNLSSHNNLETQYILKKAIQAKRNKDLK